VRPEGEDMSCEVEFIAKLRDDAKFNSLDSMKAQMKLDAAQARDLLSKAALGGM
jgi:FAD synthase